MGVPVVTLGGDTFARRHSVSHLSVSGLQDCIARNENEYQNIALELAVRARSEPNFRVNVRQTIATSPSADGQAYATSFADALESFWHRQ